MSPIRMKHVSEDASHRPAVTCKRTPDPAASWDIQHSVTWSLVAARQQLYGHATHTCGLECLDVVVHGDLCRVNGPVLNMRTSCPRRGKPGRGIVVVDRFRPGRELEMQRQLGKVVDVVEHRQEPVTNKTPGADQSIVAPVQLRPCAEARWLAVRLVDKLPESPGL